MQPIVGPPTILKNDSNRALMQGLLVVQAMLGVTSEQRAAGGVETVRKRLQVSARVRRGKGNAW